MLDEVKKHKIRFIKSCGFYANFFLIGLSVGIIGPTLIDLAIQTSTDLTQISLILPFRAGGLVVSLTKINQNKQYVTKTFTSTLKLINSTGWFIFYFIYIRKSKCFNHLHHLYDYWWFNNTYCILNKRNLGYFNFIYAIRFYIWS